MYQKGLDAEAQSEEGGIGPNRGSLCLQGVLR